MVTIKRLIEILEEQPNKDIPVLFYSQHGKHCDPEPRLVHEIDAYYLKEGKFEVAEQHPVALVL